MKFKSIITGLFLSIALFSATEVNAQQTYEEIEQLTVNEQVTTVITASEPIRFVDISTDLVAGDQPINNTVRLKPKEAGHDSRYCYDCHREIPHPVCTCIHNTHDRSRDRQRGAAIREDTLS